MGNVAGGRRGDPRPDKPAEAVAIYRHLQKTRTAPAERPVRAAAERALARVK